MKFIDEVKIRVFAGDGGRGCVSFRREKYVPRGGPTAATVVTAAMLSLSPILSSRHSSICAIRSSTKPARGQHGMGNDCHGHRGDDREIKVPVGTIIRDAATRELIADLQMPYERVIIAAGGRGGKGNTHFVSSTHRGPRFAQPANPARNGTGIGLRLLLM